MGRIRVGISIERNHAFDGIFGPFLYVAHDLGDLSQLSLHRRGQDLRLRPGVSISRRFADDPSQESYVVSFKVDLERKLTEKWWVTLTPRIRYQHFLGGDNQGRQDTIYSISTGLRYSINDHVGFRARSAMSGGHPTSTAKNLR